MSHHPILGELIDTDEPAFKDAVHMAILPVKANEELMPGDRIGLIDLHQMLASKSARPLIGIVDPFLYEEIGRGDMFWMVMLPGTTINLRHEWSHPALVFTESNPNLPVVQTDCQEMGCQ